VASSFKNAAVDLTSTSRTDLYTSPSSTTAAKTVPVPAGSTLIFDKPINLETGDKVSLTASASNDLSAYASIMEIT